MKTIAAVTILAAMLAATGCKRQDRWLKQFENEDGSLIECGNGDYSQHQILAAEPDNRILKTAEVLPEKAKRHFDRCLRYCTQDSTLAFKRIHFTGLLGDGQGRLFLTYLAFSPRPKVMAGKRVQIVLSKKRELEKILIYDIPLEKRD